MSTTEVEIETYEDTIIQLANDPNLNKEKLKTTKLVELIHNFPLTERKVSKLCSLSLVILQTLEKIELNLKNWAFLSLDINSNDHFDIDKNSSIKEFNNNISIKVLNECKNLNIKLVKVSNDLDYITKELRTLSPIEYILDSGTLLTSLNLRNIKLKSDLSDKITVAYLKAKLINIGMELESMLNDNENNDNDNDDDSTTVATYKTFVANLLKQLNNTIEEEDMSGKTECLAVINDMEKMFEAFKLEKLEQLNKFKEEEEREKFINERLAQERINSAKFIKQSSPSPEPYVNIKYSDERNINNSTPTRPHSHPSINSNSHTNSSSNLHQPPNINLDEVDDDDYSYDSDMGSNSLFGSNYNSPLIHSITKSQPTTSSSLKNSIIKHHHHDTEDSLSGSSILHKTTLSEEMPYLLSAFNLAKNVEEDIKNFTEDQEISPNSTISKNSKNSKTSRNSKNTSPLSSSSASFSDYSSSNDEDLSSSNHTLHFSNSHIPETKLSSQSGFISEQHKPSPYSYLYSNNSLLSRLGIRPQVITTDLPKELSTNTTSNIQHKKLNPSSKSKQYLIDNDKNEYGNEKDLKDKENLPLTQSNLRNHTLSSLSVNVNNDFNDQVE